MTTTTDALIDGRGTAPWGMNPSQSEAVAEYLVALGAEAQSIASELESDIEALPWNGADADACRVRVRSGALVQLSQLALAARILGDALIDEADAQRLTSRVS